MLASCRLLSLHDWPLHLWSHVARLRSSEWSVIDHGSLDWVVRASLLSTDHCAFAAIYILASGARVQSGRARWTPSSDVWVRLDVFVGEAETDLVRRGPVATDQVHTAVRAMNGASIATWGRLFQLVTPSDDVLGSLAALRRVP